MVPWWKNGSFKNKNLPTTPGLLKLVCVTLLCFCKNLIYSELAWERITMSVCLSVSGSFPPQPSRDTAIHPFPPPTQPPTPHPPPSQLCYNLHTSRDLVSPKCRIFMEVFYCRSLPTSIVDTRLCFVFYCFVCTLCYAETTNMDSGLMTFIKNK